MQLHTTTATDLQTPSMIRQPSARRATAEWTPYPASSAMIVKMAARLEPRIPELALRLVAAINASDDAYRRGGRVRSEELLQACTDNIRESVEALGGQFRGELRFESTRATGRRRAEQGLPLENLLHAYRLGWRIIWEALHADARSAGHRSLNALAEGAGMVWDMMEQYSGEVARAYRAAEAEISSGRFAQQESLLHSLMSGLASRADVEVAPGVLGLPESGPYLVAVAIAETEGSARGDAIAAALRAASVASAWLIREGRLVGLIAPRRVPTVAVVRHLATAAVRIGVSPPAETLDHVSALYRQAELALRAIPPGTRDVSTLDDRLASALLAASPDLARRLADRALRQLLRQDRDDAPVLLATLRAYIAAGGSVALVSRRLSCHRNTVINRVGRIREMTGLDPADPGDMTELVLALRAVDLQLSRQPAASLDGG